MGKSNASQYANFGSLPKYLTYLSYSNSARPEFGQWTSLTHIFNTRVFIFHHFQEETFHIFLCFDLFFLLSCGIFHKYMLLSFLQISVILTTYTKI